MLKTAILGCGGIANAHANILTKLENIKLVAFCDTIHERAENFNTSYGGGKGKIYTGYKEMFEKEKLDVVYICLPPFAHTDEVEIAASNGVHIFIEKPIAFDMETANRMVNAVEKYGVKSQVGFLFRFGDAIEVVKGMLDSGEAGQPGLMIGRYFCNSLHSAWWRDRSKSGGQVVEQVVHVFDIIRYLLGRPKTIFCQMANLFHKDVADYTVEDVSATMIGFENGALASIAATNGAIPGQWTSDFKLVAARMTVFFDDSNNATIHHTDAGYSKTTTIASDKQIMRAETLDFIEAVEKNRPTRTPMLEGAETLRLVLAIRDSAEKGQIVKL